MHWNRNAVWATALTLVFSLMHVADELWSRWDFGDRSVTSGTEAALLTPGVFIIGLWAFAWILLQKPWGYALGLALGVAVLVTGGWHFVDTSGMTTFRWAVVTLEVLSAVALVVASAGGLFATRPWSKATAALT